MPTTIYQLLYMKQMPEVRCRISNRERDKRHGKASSSSEEHYLCLECQQMIRAEEDKEERGTACATDRKRERENEEDSFCGESDRGKWKQRQWNCSPAV